MADSVNWMWIGASAAWAYAVGSVNLAVIASRLFRIQGLRETGSGNPGVTNLFRIAGAKIAVPVLLLEIAKAFVVAIPVVHFTSSMVSVLWILPFLLGNLFPLFHAFKGGKGVSAAVGALLVADWRIMLLGGCGFILMFLLFRRVSVGSLSMALCWPGAALLFHGPGMFAATAGVMTAIIFITHRENIRRLIAGEEAPTRRNKRP